MTLETTKDSVNDWIVVVNDWIVDEIPNITIQYINDGHRHI